jgi:Pentapeptide repeats (8 copies)
MADSDQLKRIKEGVEVWNRWREEHPEVVVDLRNADLTNFNLAGANLKQVNFYWADLSGANLRGANLYLATLREASLKNADLTEANLECAHFVETNVDQATLTGCTVYGISAWDLKGSPKDQSGLIVSTRFKEVVLTVDDLQMAQFIHLLIKNENVRNIIDTVTSKVVLILGRFSDERKEVLDAIRNELRNKQNFTPILFDFEKPKSKDIIGTVETMARLARFIIADLTDPSSIPYEMGTIVPLLCTTPILPIKLKGSANSFTMFENLQKNYGKWVLATQEYQDCPSLIAALPEVIRPANELAEAFRK